MQLLKYIVRVKSINIERFQIKEKLDFQILIVYLV